MRTSSAERQPFLQREEPVRVWQAPSPLNYIGFYGLFLACLSLGLVAAFCWPSFATVASENSFLDYVSDFALFSALFLAPSMVFNVLVLLGRPTGVMQHAPAPPIEETLSKLDPRITVYFRYVTRGNNPSLVKENVAKIFNVLRSTLPPSARYVVEVVTDVSVGAAGCEECAVPKSYHCPNGALFKARALHYAVESSKAERQDWIVHLDEETSFVPHTVLAIYAHVAKESALVAKGEKEYGNMAQGVITYGNTEITGTLTTLLDSTRLADDLGKFRFFYSLNEPAMGVHGSFLIVPNAVELDVGFDHGWEGSITEDSFFALKARDRGVKISYLDARMHEQSPFTVMDLIKQRRRWFGGLALVAKADSIQFKRRIVLGVLVVFWGLGCVTPLLGIIHMIFTNRGFFEVSTILKEHGMLTALSILVWSPYFWAIFCWGVLVGFSVFQSLVGFSWNFDRRQLGWAKWLRLGFSQVFVQLFLAGTIETAGATYAIVDPPRGFYLVQKQRTNTEEETAMRQEDAKVGGLDMEDEPAGDLDDADRLTVSSQRSDTTGGSSSPLRAGHMEQALLLDEPIAAPAAAKPNKSSLPSSPSTVRSAASTKEADE